VLDSCLESKINNKLLGIEVVKMSDFTSAILYISAVFAVAKSLSVCLPVCLSVTIRYCVKTV